jgi:acetyl esterase/lipase
VTVAEGVLHYGDPPWQRIDIYASASAERAGLVVIVHGGFWRHDRTARDCAPLAVSLARRGCRVAVVEYRPVWDGGAWPGPARDAQRALDALFAQDAAWADAWFVGHSVGAHVLLCGLAGRAGRHRVLLLAPVVDMALALSAGIGDGAAANLTAAHVRAGGRPDDATPRVGPADVAVLDVLAAGDDQAVPVGIVAAHVEMWTATGLPVRYRVVSEARHMHLMNPDRPAGATVLEMLAAGPVRT